MKSKSQKREEAILRQVRYSELSLEHKIVRLMERPGESKKEMARLLALYREIHPEAKNDPDSHVKRIIFKSLLES